MLVFIFKGKTCTRVLSLGNKHGGCFSVLVSITSCLVRASSRGIDRIARYCGFSLKGRSTCESHRDGIKASRDTRAWFGLETASGCNGLG